jgi:hypothetical protein
MGERFPRPMCGKVGIEADSLCSDCAAGTCAQTSANRFRGYRCAFSKSSTLSCRPHFKADLRPRERLAGTFGIRSFS